MFFDHSLSSRLDAIQWLLDHRPPWLIRLALRAYKRTLEGQVTR